MGIVFGILGVAVVVVFFWSLLKTSRERRIAAMHRRAYRKATRTSSRTK